MNLFQENVIDYLNNRIFPILLNAMEEMLIEADRQNVIKV